VLNYLDLSRSCHVTEFLRPFGNRSRKVFFNPLFFTGKLIASMCINPYAEDIFNELLTPEGNEFHFVRLPPGETMLWRDIMSAFAKSVPVGFRDGSGELRMVPRPDEEVPGSTEVVVLSENACDASIFTSPPSGRQADARTPSLRCRDVRPSGMLVIVGVNPKLPFIVEETCSLGMTVHIVDNQTGEEFSEWYAEYSRTPLPKSVVFRECLFRSEELQPEFEALFRTIIQYGEIDIACRPIDPDFFEGQSPVFGDLLVSRCGDAIPLGWIDKENVSRKKGGELQKSAPMVVLNPAKDWPVPRNASIIYLKRQSAE
jgi:hypothetical protein